MSLTAPYTNAMRLGQGFNTYTQEIRIENAVKFAPKPVSEGTQSPRVENGVPAPEPTPQPVEDAPKDVKPDTKEVEAANGTTEVEKTTFNNATLVTEGAAVLTQPAEPAAFLPFTLPKTPPPKSSQIVTYSTRAIDNVSDIMDALNISTAESIKYGTIHGNASASFVNENKVLDSQLNYIVSVKVNNNDQTDPEEMEFQPIDSIPPEKFTEVYGDCFISGFLEGGEFNAVISVDVHDKSKLRSVKQAIDLSLAVGPSPVSVEAKEALDKEHREVLQDTEITISVNWSGGGEIKRPDVPWTLSSVVQIANAFPSMVAHCSAKTSAILTRYTSLRSFQAWKYKMAEQNQDWLKKEVILNYAPCQLYTADLFDAYMAYKKLWKRIDYIMQDTSKWKAREPPKTKQLVPPTLSTTQSGSGYTASPSTRTPITPAEFQKENIKVFDKAAQQPSQQATPQASQQQTQPPHSTSPGRQITFHVDDPLIVADWDLKNSNETRDPIPLDPVALNEARLLCREAMTLITEEAARLVDHPDLAYAEFDAETGKTRMKKPNYAYPEVLKGRLPIYVRNDAANDSYSRDATAIMVQQYSRSNDLFYHIVGDVPNPHRKYTPFVSLHLNEAHGSRDHGLCGLSLHAYHHRMLAPGHFSKDSDNAIGAIGFRFLGDKVLKEDHCSQHVGRPHFDDSSKFASLDLTAHTISAPANASNGAVQEPSKQAEADITCLEIAYVPGSGRIAGLTFYDKFGTASSARLSWKQWGSAGREPEGLKIVKQEPPADGERWKFVGLGGDFDESIWGTVLSRVGAIWRRA